MTSGAFVLESHKDLDGELFAGFLLGRPEGSYTVRLQHGDHYKKVARNDKDPNEMFIWVEGFKHKTKMAEKGI